MEVAEHGAVTIDASSLTQVVLLPPAVGAGTTCDVEGPYNPVARPEVWDALTYRFYLAHKFVTQNAPWEDRYFAVVKVQVRTADPS
ncbi:hypothetical protein Thermus71318_10440 [Thermus brockianus]